MNTTKDKIRHWKDTKCSPFPYASCTCAGPPASSHSIGVDDLSSFLSPSYRIMGFNATSGRARCGQVISFQIRDLPRDLRLVFEA